MTTKNFKTLLGLSILTFMLALMCACGSNGDLKLKVTVPAPLQGDQGIPGESVQGEAGIQGNSGYNAVIDVVMTSSCSNGGYTLLTATDSNENSLVDALDSNYKATQVCNGLDGSDGQDGSNGVNGTNGILAIVDPCGDKPGVHDEVLIRLANGQLLASFSNNVNGDYTRFSILQPGSNYVTTDGSGCYFSVDAINQLFNEHY